MQNVNLFVNAPVVIKNDLRGAGINSLYMNMFAWSKLSASLPQQDAKEDFIFVSQVF